MKKYILAAGALWFAGQALAADFSGNWGYEQELEDGIYGKYFNIKQSPKYIISGEWNEGRSNGPGGSGKVKGYVKRGKLYLSYCSEGDDSWYTHCPKYEKDRGYFVRRNGQLVEYYSLHGKRNAYRKGDVFTRQKEKAADASE